MTDQILYGVTLDGTLLELCRWLTDGAEYDAQGWLEEYGSLLGSDIGVRLPDGNWVGLGKFCILRGAEAGV